MANIELVIKIPEGLKNDFESEQWTALSCMEMKNALMNSIPLHKGHGRLIDADAIPEQIELKGFLSQDNAHLVTIYRVKEALDNVPTIIEADTESEG